MPFALRHSSFVIRVPRSIRLSTSAFRLPPPRHVTRHSSLSSSNPFANFVIRHSSFVILRFQRDHTQGDPCATGHSPRSNPQRRRIDRPRSAIDRDQTTAGTDWPEPALPLPGLVRSNPHPAGPLRSRHLHLRRSLHGRSPRASVVVLHRGAKKEISRIITGAPSRLLANAFGVAPGSP